MSLYKQRCKDQRSFSMSMEDRQGAARRFCTSKCLQLRTNISHQHGDEHGHNQHQHRQQVPAFVVPPVHEHHVTPSARATDLAIMWPNSCQERSTAASAQLAIITNMEILLHGDVTTAVGTHIDQLCTTRAQDKSHTHRFGAPPGIMPANFSSSSVSPASKL